MARNTLSQKGPGKGGKKAPTGENRGVLLALAGFTAVAIVVIALFAIISTTGGGASNFTLNNQGLLEAGTQVPEFTSETVGGGNVSVGGGSAEATMLVFFATWCPRCQNEAPVISELESEYEDLKIVMIGIDQAQGDNPEEVRNFMEEYDIQSPAVYEPSLGGEYQVSSYPTAYVLDDNAEVVVANSGEAPREAYEEWIQEALGS
jgi:thiol-disulfide isomerase/thioredoxin